MKIFSVSVFIVAAIIFMTALSGYISNVAQPAAVIIAPVAANDSTPTKRINVESSSKDLAGLPEGCTTREGYSPFSGVPCDTYFPVTSITKFTEKDLTPVNVCVENFRQCLIDAVTAKERCLRNPLWTRAECDKEATNDLNRCTNAFMRCLWPEQYPKPGSGPFPEN